ncbi:MAG: 1-(5-phosphoribosyl)-5-[(5-phosphoribosylamino)methylideneamino]imidazole-4-carboxamide isomerase [Acidobacteriota bacterium]|nr:MAG: 1-(5-phosphoribosyl)-5-[(5-phosphoribosylamino)methylideneamino]imidazole-4-carboxamide isomerase [Acidobacteriota bacterium]
MLILPAIDLIDGRCVRLRQGDFAQVTRYEEDPASVARRFEAEGADGVHVVDLEGARTGGLKELAAVGRISRAVSIPVEVGGGVRRPEDAEALFSAGAARVVVGTTALREPELLAQFLARFGASRVWCAVDMRDGRLMASGWTEKEESSPEAFLGALKERGVETAIHTDVRRDGMLEGPNVEKFSRLREAGLNLVASGGVTSVDHVLSLLKAGAFGVIVGRALYESRLTVAEIVSAVRGGERKKHSC